MSLVQWNPFREFSVMQTPIDQVWRSALAMAGEGGPESSWVPAVDVYETDDHTLVVSADLSGVDPADVSVTFENGMLTISGERKVDGDVDRTRMYRSERPYGSFRRSFTLPRTVDTEAVTAEHKAGTLRVRLPQKDEAKPHRIAVKAA